MNISSDNEIGGSLDI